MLMTVREVAKTLNRTRACVYSWIRKGLNSYKGRNGIIYLNITEVEEYLSNRWKDK